MREHGERARSRYVSYGERHRANWNVVNYARHAGIGWVKGTDAKQDSNMLRSLNLLILSTVANEIQQIYTITK